MLDFIKDNYGITINKLVKKLKNKYPSWVVIQKSSYRFEMVRKIREQEYKNGEIRCNYVLYTDKDGTFTSIVSCL